MKPEINITEEIRAIKSALWCLGHGVPLDYLDDLRIINDNVESIKRKVKNIGDGEVTK